MTSAHCKRLTRFHQTVRWTFASRFSHTVRSFSLAYKKKGAPRFLSNSRRQKHKHTLMENLITSRKMVIEKLLEGRDLVNQLQSVLAHKNYSDGSSVVALTAVENLVTKILESFSNTLLILNVDSELVDDISVSKIRADSRVNSACLDSRKSVDSRESCRSTTTTFAIEDRRSCHKKR